MMSEVASKKRSAPSGTDSTPQEARSATSRDDYMDSLPYVDAVHDDYEQYALSLIEDEMKAAINKPRQNRDGANLRELPPLNYRTPAMKHEYQTRFLANATGADSDDPSLTTSHSFKLRTKIDPPEGENVQAWRDAVLQSRVRYESERARGMALEVKKDAGAALLWKGFNGSLDQDAAVMQSALASQRQTVEQINLQRSEDQQKAGKQLHILTTQYQTALERRFQLQRATATLEQEVNQQHQAQ